MAEPPNVSLTLSNQPDNVVLVREALSAMADAVGVDGVELNDIRTAVTEACNNVVLHAYEGEEGPLELELYVGGDAVEVVVRDNGTGIRPHIRADGEAALGIGLSIIQALAPRVEFRDVAGGGTEVRMEFATPSARALQALAQNGFHPPDVARSELATTTGLAARARFTTDRIADAELVADALVAQASQASAVEHLTMSVAVEPRSLELRVGPLHDGRAEHLIEGSVVGDVGPVIQRLTDDQRLLADGSGKVLALRLRDER
jgi:anti-sigma regulatory factor (Ser/Thr protein kinase)